MENNTIRPVFFRLLKHGSPSHIITADDNASILQPNGLQRGHRQYKCNNNQSLSNITLSATNELDWLGSLMDWFVFVGLYMLRQCSYLITFESVPGSLAEPSIQPSDPSIPIEHIEHVYHT